MLGATSENEVNPFYVIASGATWDSTSSAQANLRLVEDGHGRILLASDETK